MGIPPGSVLRSLKSEHTAEVVSDRLVLFEGQTISLSAATRAMLQIDYSVRPIPHWSYAGRPLREFYVETYGEVES